VDDAPTGRTAQASFVDDILHYARLRPEQPAIILPDRLVSYDMLAQGIVHAEARISSLELKPDELVCVTLASPIRHLIVVAALFRLGRPSLSAASVDEIVGLKFPARVYLEDAGGALTPGLRRILVDEDWFAGPRLPIRPALGFASEGSLCRVGFSSGTTGVPKAVWFSAADYRRIVGEAHKVSDALGVRGRVLNLLRTSGGWGLALTAHALSSGGTVVFADSARQALQMASAYQVDAIVASTQQVRDLVREQTRAPIPCPSVKALMFAGALAPPALMIEARARLCAQAIVLYGATEAGAVAVTPVDLVMGVEGAVGYPQTGVTLEIVDADDRPLARGVSGVVRMRTPSMAQPFPLGAKDAHPGLRGGWFYPGDRGRLTEDGMLALEGRTNEVINTGGVKRAPELIEEVVLSHPNVAEVAAFGAVGTDGIEEVNLAVVARAPIAERHLIDWCAERGLGVARVFAVDSLPRTPLGKVRREELKANLIG
jgi:acyl-coenzyme A synthetase/AMP-(fatty) acid ligase